ncbi:hypothetical protein [Candidatus Nitrospira bockiana]
MNWTRLVWGLGVLGVCAIFTTGCDYWPPALQAQIEQLQAEAQATAAERAKLLGQLNEANKIKDELQARVDDLSRTNRELMAKVSGLEQALVAEKEKVTHLAKAKAVVKPAAKPAKAVAKPAKAVSKKPDTKKKPATSKKRD